MRRGENWQGTAFLIWVASGFFFLFLLRHPAGREFGAGPWGGAAAAAAAILGYVGWALGWPERVRPAAFTAAFIPAAICAGLRLPAPWGVELEAALFPLFLRSISLPSLRLPRLALALPSFPALRLPRPRPKQEEVEADLGPALPPWADADWLGGEETGPAVALEEPGPEALEEVRAGAFTLPEVEEGEEEIRPALEEPGPEIPEEVPVGILTLPEAEEGEEEARPEEKVRPAALAPSRPDRAILLARSVLGLLHRNGVDCPALHLEAGKDGTALEFLLSSRRQGERISSLRRKFEEAVGAAPGEALQGQILRLSFPAYARADAQDGAADALWVPLGKTERGGRWAVNPAAVGPLFILGEDVEALTAEVYAVLGSILASSSSEVWTAEESRRYLYGIGRYFEGAECVAELKERVYERSHKKVSSPPVLALILLPSAGVQEEIPPLLLSGPSVGVYPIVVLNTPGNWTTKTLVAMGRARLLFRVDEEESRFYLGRSGAEGLGEGRALYYFSEADREPCLLRAYQAAEDDLQLLLAGLETEEKNG